MRSPSVPEGYARHYRLCSLARGVSRATYHHDDHGMDVGVAAILSGGKHDRYLRARRILLDKLAAGVAIL